jgi:hypothetical protein
MSDGDSAQCSSGIIRQPLTDNCPESAVYKLHTPLPRRERIFAQACCKLMSVTGNRVHCALLSIVIPWVICFSGIKWAHFVLTYSRSWALLERPPIVQPLKNFSAFHGTRRLNTMFTRALLWSLSWAIPIQTTPSHLISLRSILILSTHLRLGLPSGLFPSGFPTNILYAFFFSCNVLHSYLHSHLVYGLRSVKVKVFLVTGHGGP